MFGRLGTNQALSALLSLCRELLSIDTPWLKGLNRPAQKRRTPQDLTREEVASPFQSLVVERAFFWASCSAVPTCDGRKGFARESKMWTLTSARTPWARLKAASTVCSCCRHRWPRLDTNRGARFGPYGMLIEHRAQGGGVETSPELPQKYLTVGPPAWDGFWLFCHLRCR